MTATLSLQAVLDGLGQAVLIFGNDGRLIHDNLAARTFLGTDITLIRDKGWEAATALLNATQTNPEKMIDHYKQQALDSERPVRFNIFRSGEYIPCWATTILGDAGEVCTMITIDMPDWTAMQELLNTFRDELSDAVFSTKGHVDIIDRDLDRFDPEKGKVDQLKKRVSGLTRLIGLHMDRTGRLMTMLERLEDIRIGMLRSKLKAQRKKIVLEDFFEDFIEELDQIQLVDPETEAHDHRSRITLDLPPHAAVSAATSYLTRILQDVLRNAIMYSMKATPIKIKVALKGQSVQIDLIDDGYGIRERERERVFESFKRARQPQIIGEFGYGLSLYLCKYEVEAMNGKMWFESEEGVGTTFSIMLPTWREVSAASSDSSSSTS
jgi:signal transduction histidine kinase